MSRERDPLIDNAAVKLYRDLARWNTNWIQRREIAATVDETNKREMELFQAVIEDHLLTGKWAGNVKVILSEFERLSRRRNGTRL